MSDRQYAPPPPPGPPLAAAPPQQPHALHAQQMAAQMRNMQVRSTRRSRVTRSMAWRMWRERERERGGGVE